MIRTHYSHEIKPSMDGKKVTVAGWVQHIRVLGSLGFLKIRDREGLSQVTIKKDNLNFKLLKELTLESVVVVTGIVKKSDQAELGWELIPDKIKLLSRAEVPLPLDISGKIKSEIETRLNTRFMDLRQTKVKAIFMIEDCITTAIHKSLDDQGFIEVYTPKIVVEGAEGGATLFPIKYFGRSAYLAQSPQLYKQMMMATGFDRVYEIASYFRAEPSATTRHIAEFTMLDGEVSFIIDYNDIIKILERTICDVFKHVKKHAVDFLEILGKELTVPKRPFVRLTHNECNKLLKQPQGSEIDTVGERKIGEIVKKEHDHDFVFITEFPTGLKKEMFYIMRKEDDPKYTTSFDLEYKGLELVTGNQREHRYDILINQMREANVNPSSFRFYLSAFRYGMPCHGGWGFGLERFVQKMLDLPNIREARLFPRDIKRLTP